MVNMAPTMDVVQRVVNKFRLIGTVVLITVLVCAYSLLREKGVEDSLQMSHNEYSSSQHVTPARPYQELFAGIATGYHVSVLARFNILVKNGAGSQDPELVQVARNMILGPDQKNRIIKIIRNRQVRTPQADAVAEIFQSKKEGFFLECGAFDGETSSNTVYLEQQLGWTGLLVEMDPYFYTQLRGKNRRSHSINACISPIQRPTQVEYKQSNGQLGKLTQNWSNSTQDTLKATKDSVPCFPLETLLLAMNQTRLDYFSLDVEGLELDVIRTIPFDRLDIRVISVEHRHVPEGKETLREYMEQKNYTLYKDISFSKGQDLIWVEDYIFVKNSVWKTLPHRPN